METPGPVLIVDDEEDLLNLVDLHLRREGFATLKARNGREALELFEAHRPALVVLDLMLPDMTGTEVCRRIRSHPLHGSVPVIMLSARGEEIDRVVGFEVGADDYVVKANFSVRELALRVRARLRGRVETPEPEPPRPAAGELVYPLLRVDEAAHRVWVEGAEIVLTATEFKLLITLARRQGRVQTRGALLEDVWDMPPDLNTRTVDTHVKRLREKLGAASVYVETVRGVGYRFEPEPAAD
jgi:two-component system phosphate regulon response regulator PhoB